MKTGAAFVGFLFSAGVGFAVGYAVKSTPGDAGSTGKAVAKTGKVDAKGGPSGGGDSDLFKVPVGDSYAKGPADALVTIVEFSDFQCPFCSRVNPTISQLQKQYGDDLRVVFKHQPLPFHREAPLASEYALAAGEQGKFWEMHDKLFENQKALKEADLKRYAEELGLDVGKVQAFIESGKGKKAVQEDQALARKLQATGTPSFFINGEKLVGAQPFPKFKEVVDRQLANAKALVAKGTSKSDVYAELTKNGRTTAPPPKPKQPREQPAQTRQKVELVDGTPMKGAKDPIVTIVEWSDFECPFCGRVNPTLKQVMDTYAGKVQIRFRNQPLSFHKNALPAAKAALAAHEQGKFWEMHDKLFENRTKLQQSDLEGYAKELGLNVSKFKADMNSPKIQAKVAKDQADANKYGARGTPTLFVNGVPVRGAQPFPAFKKVIDEELKLAEKLMKSGVKKQDLYAEILKREGGKTVGGGAPAKPSAPPKPAGPVDIELGKAPVYGPKNAPIEVVVFSDFECPFCGRVNPSIEQLKKEYKGKVKVAFKHFPLSFHKNAKPAAIASLAAHRQGKFWEMHDKLFENQRALQESDFVKYAQELGLNVAKFKMDLQDPALAKWVDQDMAEGSKVGVRGTPATFINGRMVSGAQPYPAFKSVVDEELKKEG